MKNSVKFSVAIILILATSLSGCVYPGERWGYGGDRGEHGDRGGHSDRGDRGDRGGDRGDRGGEHGDR